MVVSKRKKSHGSEEKCGNDANREKDAVSNQTSEMDLDAYEQDPQEGGEVAKKGTCYGKTITHVNTIAVMEIGKDTQKEVNLNLK